MVVSHHLTMLDNDLLHSFSNAYYDNSSSVISYILKIVQIASKISEFNVPMTDDFVVQCVLDSLPLEYEKLKIPIQPLRRSGV